MAGNRELIWYVDAYRPRCVCSAKSGWALKGCVGASYSEFIPRAASVSWMRHWQRWIIDSWGQLSDGVVFAWCGLKHGRIKRANSVLVKSTGKDPPGKTVVGCVQPQKTQRNRADLKSRRSGLYQIAGIKGIHGVHRSAITRRWSNTPDVECLPGFNEGQAARYLLACSRPVLKISKIFVRRCQSSALIRRLPALLNLKSSRGAGLWLSVLRLPRHVAHGDHPGAPGAEYKSGI